MGLFGKRKKQYGVEGQESPALRKNRARGGIFQRNSWICWGMAICLAGAFLFSSFYGRFQERAETYEESPLEDAENIAWLYQSIYLLYRDLRNAQAEEKLDYSSVYLEADEGYQWILDEKLLEEGLLGEELLEGYPPGAEIAEYGELAGELAWMQGYFVTLENRFRELNSNYDYIIQDDSTGKYITNMSEEDRNRDVRSQYFQISFLFDESGNVTVGDTIRGKEESQLRKSANEAIREVAEQGLLGVGMQTFRKYGKVKAPAGCTVTFAVSDEAWEARGRNMLQAYVDAGVGSVVFYCMLLVALLGAFLPVFGRTKPWMEQKLCAVSLEYLLCVVFLYCFAAYENLILNLVVYVASGEARQYLGSLEPFFHLGSLTLFFFGCWYVGVCARAVRELGVRRYLGQRSLVYRFFPYMKKRAVGVYEWVAHMDLTQDANGTILKLLLVNGGVLFLISCLWFGGFGLTIVYSILLYVVLRKYISELQKRYRILLKAVDEIAEGRLDVAIQEDLGVFEPFREQVYKIQDGLQKAVDTEVKSQRMKVELVTNMSHDLKTPLTAIITYINLMKEEGVTEGQRREYLATLERKSLRLKGLIEDLFEFSKASSQNVTLNIMDVDIMSLVKQVAFEMSGKLGEAGLDMRMNLTEEKVILPLDSQKTYRIYENLFGNIAKYALPGTRVYVNGFRIDDAVVVTLKNISAQEITVDCAELTERFVRGDASRNTEGSGLGLAIAKSFMELQGGQLELEVDGDLFKVTTTWHFAASGL